MNRSLILIALVGLITAQLPPTPAPFPSNTGCPDDQFLYNSICVLYACINHDLASLSLVTSQGDNVGEFNRGFNFQAQALVEPNTGLLLVRHTIYFQDNQVDSLLKPDLCLDATIYQIPNDYEVDATRLYEVAGTIKPTFPGPVFSQYLTDSGERSLFFDLTQVDLDTTGCIKTLVGGNYVYYCFFELAITLVGRTQASYYFSSIITIQTNLIAATCQVDWVKIIEKDVCVEGDPSCSVAVQIPSELSFCDDINCTNAQKGQFGMLWLNKTFYIQHALLDPTYSNWLVLLRKAVFVAPGFKMALQPLIRNEMAGRSVYSFNVPLVQQGVTIAMNSILTRPLIGGNRMLQEEDTTKEMQSKITVGCIVQNEGDKCGDAGSIQYTQSQSKSGNGIISQSQSTNTSSASTLFVSLLSLALIALLN